jgi:hypothetical protein
MKTQSESETVLLADDPGASGCRLFGQAGWVDVPAHVATNGRDHLIHVDGLARMPDPPVRIEPDGLPAFYVGANCALFGTPVENLDHERQAGSPELRAVLYAALSEYQAKRGGKLRGQVRLGVALPNALLMGDQAEQNKARAKAWLHGEHCWRADGRVQIATIDDVRVTTQGVAAMFDYLLDPAGAWIPDRAGAMRKEIGVISIGFDTIELTVVRDRVQYPALTSGEKQGARRLLELADPQGLTPISLLEPELRAGRLDVSEILPVWSSKVLGLIDRVWGKSWKRFAAIVVVGGGAVLLQDEIARYFVGRANIPAAPTLAVARGLYKLLLNQQRKAAR